MAEKIFLLGNSGTGKSTSLRNLDEKETFIIQCVNKKLPFQGWKTKYTDISIENPSGNKVVSKDYSNIAKRLKYIDVKRKEIKTVIIDDSSYLLTNDFMTRIPQKTSGNAVFEKYNFIAHNFYTLLELVDSLRDDLIVVFIAHTQTEEDGSRKFKTVGKLLDNMIVLEGLVTIVLESSIRDNKYVFQTNKKAGNEPCKSPLGMFEEDELFIDNDLNVVLKKIRNFDN